jgi:hypothetical protein
MHLGESAYYIADSWFVDRARELSGASPALINLSITADRGNRLPAGTMALTAAGRDVLDGRADRVRLCGIDRWLGGVHLKGTGPAWRWSARSGRLLEA